MPNHAHPSPGAPPQLRKKWKVSLLLVGSMIAGLMAFGAAPAEAATTTNMAWSVTNNQVAAANTNFSYSFTTATAGTIKTMTFVVSGAGIAGTPTIVRSFGIPAGTVARTAQTITYTVTTPVVVAAGVPIYVEFGAMTNTTTAGSYTTAITTQTSVPATIDTGTTPAVTFAANNTAVTVSVAKSLTSTLNTTAFTNNLDPSLPALADQTTPVGLTVQTNANSGYTLAVNDSATGLQCTCTGNPVLPKVSTGKATSLVWPGPSKWGYTVTATGATADPAFTGAKYAGYTSAGETIATENGPTGTTADTITINNRLAIDYSTVAGTYADTITYSITPNYT
jgi:hypothetical protein